MSVLFSNPMGMKDSNEAEVLAIFEALPIFSRSFQRPLMVESDFVNAITWMYWSKNLGSFSFLLTRSSSLYLRFL